MAQANFFMIVKVWDYWIQQSYLSLGSDKGVAIVETNGRLWLLEKEIEEAE